MSESLPQWSDPRGCSHCDHAGMDMDMDPYCAAPKVVEKHPYGLVINQALPKICKGELWTERKPR